MATLKEYLKDHPVIAILGGLASIGSIVPVVIALTTHPDKKNEPEQKKENTAGIISSDTKIDNHFYLQEDRNKSGLSLSKNDNVMKADSSHIGLTTKNAFTGIAVIAADNGGFDRALTSKLNEWASQAGVTSQSVLQAGFINDGTFNRIMDHDLKELKRIKPLVSGYICLLRCNTTFENSGIDESLIMAKTVWEIVIINMHTDEVILSKGDTATASARSQDSATQRNYEEIFKSLSTQKINLT